jgi:hypothetical protein
LREEARFLGPLLPERFLHRHSGDGAPDG